MFMTISEPFQLSDQDVRQASLEASDIGTWCVIVSGCYHLFGSEEQARSAYEKYRNGVLVR